MTDVNAGFAVEDGVAEVELQRPEKLNAVEMPTKRAIIDRLKAWRDVDAVRVVVFSGQGKAFCAGGDLQEVVERDYALEPFTESWDELFSVMRGMPQPTVVKVQDHAYGGGFDLLLHADVPVAADDARIGQPESSLGIVNHFSPPELVHRVGLPTAMDIVLTGEPVSGARADEVGLVARSVPREELDDEVDDVAESLAAKSPRVLSKLKRGLYRAADTAPSAAKDHLEAVSLEAARTEPDYREGVDARLEDREPEWTEDG